MISRPVFASRGDLAHLGPDRPKAKTKRCLPAARGSARVSPAWPRVLPRTSPHGRHPSTASGNSGQIGLASPRPRSSFPTPHPASTGNQAGTQPAMETGVCAVCHAMLCHATPLRATSELGLLTRLACLFPFPLPACPWELSQERRGGNGKAIARQDTRCILPASLAPELPCPATPVRQVATRRASPELGPGPMHRSGKTPPGLCSLRVRHSQCVGTYCTLRT